MNLSQRKYACKYPGCRNAYYTNITNNKHFYTLPKNPEDFESWLFAMQFPASVLSEPKTKNWRICEDHFLENDFVNATKQRLVFNAMPVPVIARLETSSPNITMVHKVKTENYVPNGITTVSNIGQTTKNVVTTEPTGTTKKTAKVFQIPQMSNLVNYEEQKDVYMENAIYETKPTLGCGDELQNEVASNIDLCGDPIELNEICICCLNVTQVFTLCRSFVGNVSALTLYETISDIEVKEEEVPAVICSQCMRLLSRIDDFVKMLIHSHKVLLEAANSIKKTVEDDPEAYDLKKNEIIHKALKQKSLIPLDDEMFQYIKRELQAKTYIKQESQVEKSSSDSQNVVFQRKCFRSPVYPDKIYNNGDGVAALGARELSKVRIEETNTEIAITSSERSIEDKAIYRDYCPFCCKRVRFFVRHSRYVHSVDWFTFRCLRCFYHHKLPGKLIEHCKSCGITSDKDSQVTSSDCHDKSDVESTLVIGDDSWLSDVKLEKDVERVPIKKKKKNFVCNKCNNFSSTEFDKIEEHVLNVHCNEKACVLCKRQYTRYQAMIYHIKTFHGKRKCCKLCLIKFNNDQEAEEHYKSEAHCTCIFCKRQFQNRRQLYRHWRIHDSPVKKNAGPFKCSECSGEYVSRNGLYRHRHRHKNIRYLCEACGQSYATRRSLRSHYRSVHEGIRNVWMHKSHLCETCGVDLTTNSRYKVEVHKAMHAGNNFVCRRCYASFPTKDLHEQHTNELNHRLFECQICRATFVLSDAFRLHVEKNHGNPQEWTCRYCSKVLKTKRILQNHEKIHTRERPYKCAVCNQAFVKFTNMKKHRALHYRSGGIIQQKQFRGTKIVGQKASGPRREYTYT